MAHIFSSSGFWKRLSSKRKIWELDTVDKFYNIYKRHNTKNSFGSAQRSGVIPAQNAPPPFPVNITAPQPSGPMPIPEWWELLAQHGSGRIYIAHPPPEGGDLLSRGDNPPSPWLKIVTISPLKTSVRYINPDTRQECNNIPCIYKIEKAAIDETDQQKRIRQTQSRRIPAMSPAKKRKILDVANAELAEKKRDERMRQLAENVDFLDYLGI